LSVTYEWRGSFESRDVEALHAEAFGHVAVEGFDWAKQVEDHSLGWVCARDAYGALVGFVNVAWDGAGHAFVLDTMVSGRAGRQGIGTRLVAIAVEQARAAGCEWLHVDFEDELRPFYLEACGFSPIAAGVIRLERQPA
jgi:ribosomal protein S18 acetylase RimI-like enzyme